MRLLGVAAAVGLVVTTAALAAPAQTPLKFVWPTAVALEPSGSLLVIENGLRRLLRVDPATGRTTTIATLTKPYAVERTRSGSILVTDGPQLRRISGGRPPVVVARVDSDIGPIAVARNGDVYFTTESAMFRLAEGKGAPVQIAPKAQLAGPHGLAVARDGTLLVSDTSNGRILRIDPASGRVAAFARIAVPRGLVVAADGSVCVVDGGSSRVLRLSASGKRLGFVGRRFNDPYALALAPGGAVYVVESLQSGDVRRVARDGTVTTVSRR